MFKKCNDHEIILQLLNSRSHIREIARVLELNPATVSRALSHLMEKNVVDCTFEGKNQIYFLKDGFEAEVEIINSENYKKLKLLSLKYNIRDIYKKIRNMNVNEMIVLFGSYSKDLEKQTSDIDIYVETKNKDLKLQIENISEDINVKIGDFDSSSFLGKEIIKNHVILQGVEDFYYLLRSNKK